jgi:predicted ATPase with chaperone activity
MNELSTNNYVNEIKKIKNKIGNEDRILRLDNPLKKSITVSKSEVIIFTLSSFLTIFSLGIVLFEFILSDNKKNNFDYQNASLYEKKMNDSLTLNLSKNHSKFKSYYENLNASKQIKFNSDYSIHTFKKYEYQITNLMDEKIILEQIIKKLENQKKEILLEKEILDYKNILIGQQSEQKILKLEENLAALNSKTEIQNQKLSTAIDMIENLQLERINLLSKLNFSNSNNEQLALQN